MGKSEQLEALEVDLAEAVARFLGGVLKTLEISRSEMSRRIGVSRGALDGLLSGRVLPTATQWWAIRRAFKAASANVWLFNRAGQPLGSGTACSIRTSPDGQYRATLRIGQRVPSEMLVSILQELSADDVRATGSTVIIQEQARAGALLHGQFDLSAAAARRVLSLLPTPEV